MRRRRIALAAVACLTTALAFVPSSPVHAATSKGSFEWMVEENTASASNGDVVEVSGEGTFDVAHRTATGEATFVHTTSTGELFASGTLEIEGLVSFQFYGCGVVFGQPLPPNYCGGRVALTAHLVGHPASDPSATIEADALLTIQCEIGNPPPGSSEGITLNVKDVINFNNHLVGDNLFIMD